VLVRAGSESELVELIPIAEDALLALGATDVMVQPIQNIHVGEYTALFIVEGLGGGKRWSSTHKKQFRTSVAAFLPSQIREPNFQNASSVLDPRDLEEVVEASLYAREYGLGMQTPDSDRTRRAKARSKARRKLTRRPNSKSRR
jgi:tRNA(Met) C34 N-acetyltransferase TmcA